MKKTDADLIAYLRENRENLTSQWFERVLADYPPETARILRGEKDPMANPLGSTTLAGISGLLDYLMASASREAALNHLTAIIRVHAIQDRLPSQAVSFLTGIKKIVLEGGQKKFRDGDPFWPDYLLFAERVDDLILAALDIFMQSREQIYQLRVDEAKSSLFTLLQRKNLIQAE